MSTRFDRWWMRVKLPWWSEETENAHQRQSDILQLCQKAYTLGRKHLREEIKEQDKWYEPRGAKRP